MEKANATVEAHELGGTAAQTGVPTEARNFGPEPVNEYSPYPRYEPGIYEAECKRAEIYRDAQFRSWKCVLQFSILPGGDPISCFLHLGSESKAKAPPRSEYRRAWIIANRAQPRKRQTLSPRVFVGKIYQIRVRDVQKRFDGREHPTASVYSVVKEIVRRTYP
jgi:hypothetical protein